MQKPCLECGKIFIKRSYESRARFELKKFCSNTCSWAYLKKNKLGWFGDRDKLFGLNYEDREALKALAEYGYDKEEDETEV